jgi:hypothetical protein
MKLTMRCVLLLSLLMPVSAAAAADELEQIAASVPADVTEMVSGGVWTNDGASGYYRAMVITPGPSRPVANVVVQLLAVDKADTPPKVQKSIVIKEVADQKIANAFLAMDAENENEMTLVVTAYGTGNDQDTTIHLKFDAKGGYQVLPGGAEEEPAEADPATKK